MKYPNLPFFPLSKGRTHEVCGAGTLAFAGALAAEVRGSVLWVRETWQPEQLHPQGFADFLNLADLVLCKAKNQIDALAVAEDALRSGAVPLVVVEVSKPLNLTHGRRLQLAARAGRNIGLVIMPEGMGSNAAETRWQCEPMFDPETEDSTLQRWKLIKNKSGTLGVWYVRWDRATRRLFVVSSSGE